MPPGPKDCATGTAHELLALSNDSNVSRRITTAHCTCNARVCLCAIKLPNWDSSTCMGADASEASCLSSSCLAPPSPCKSSCGADSGQCKKNCSQVSRRSLWKEGGSGFWVAVCGLGRTGVFNWRGQGKGKSAMARVLKLYLEVSSH